MTNKSIYIEVKRVTACQNFTDLRTSWEFDETLCEYPIEELRHLTRRQIERVTKANGTK